MEFLLIAGEGAFVILLVFFAWFSLTSLKEKEQRAFWRSLLVCGLLLLINALLWLIPAPLRAWLFGAVFLNAIIMIVWLIFSPSPKKTTEIIGKQKKVDERDVIFARFDLEPDSERYVQYYQDHPEFQSIDQRIRALPDILTPGHLKKNPVLMSLADAEFDFLEHLLTQVTGDKRSKSLNPSPPQATASIKNILRYLGADDCVVCELDQAYVYSHVGRGPEKYGQPIDLNHKYAVVFTVEMGWDMIASAPLAPVIVETGHKYVQAAQISIIAAHFIRRMGYPARAHIAGSNYQAILPPLGGKAGLGEVGRLGILITRKHGPRARLGLITTDCPLIPDKPQSYGIQNFCEKCQKCARNCPAQAIPFGDKTEENGAVKWVLNREECYRYWRKAGTDCALCIYVCPYSKPENVFHNFIRKAAIRSTSFQSLSVWGDDVFYGRVPVRKASPL